ncbi:IclR family transcriptional regulator C-terminal domain-containing protein [Arthrobacter ginkgonis]|uniref:IclR family transcriptional regulator C-terminal domain-containing protein n=1 Tax=Arthrobacter ginkgonis TaxID=1630594 RepID=A0ABP7CZG0_9MICC
MNTIQLLMKAGQIADEVARTGPSTPAELAKAISEPRSTVYRIVGALEYAGLLRQAGEGRLELGTTILRLGDAAANALVDRAALHAQLRRVRGQLGLSSYFCVPRENGAVCLDQVEGSDVDLLDLAPGRTLPLHAGAASQILLAFGSPEFRAAALETAPFERIASRTPTTAAALQAELKQAASRGWSVEDSELIEGAASIAVPVFRQDGSLLGAIAIAGLRTNILGQEATGRQVLTAAAQAITDSLSGETPAGAQAAPAGTAGEAAKGSPKTSAVLAKASALMEALAQERIATSTRLTELLNEPVTSVYRMLATLAEAGWVEQIGHRGAYRVGSKMLSLAGELTRRLDIRRAAVPVLRDIHEQTGETTFLCIRSGTRAVCIERIDGTRVSSRVLKLGESLPLHVGAAPRALLAFESRDAWEEYASIVAHSGEPWRDVRSRTEFFAGLEEIQAQGFVRNDNNVTPGIAAVGAPIFNHRGEVVASLSASGLREGILTEPAEGPSVTELVLRGAQALSDYLGSPAGQPKRLTEGPGEFDVSRVIV